MPTKKKAKHKASGSRLQTSGQTHKHIPEARSPKPEAALNILANLETALADIGAAIAALASGSGLQASGKDTEVEPEARSLKSEASSREQRLRREKRALLEAKIAALEEKMALLDEEEGEEDMRHEEQVAADLRAADSSTRNSTMSELTHNSAAGTSAATSPRAKLTAPTNLVAVPVGSSFIRVSWNAVTNAKGYLVQYSSDSGFVNDTHALMLDAPTTSITLSGLKADTMYHIKVKALAFDGDTGSDFTMAYLVRSGVATDGETATHLQSWLEEQQSVFQNFTTLLPQLESTVLTVAERRRLLGSGVRRYGYVDKVSDVAADYPQFWPASANLQDAMKERLREIESLRSLLVWTRYVNRVVGDLLLLAGHDTFRMASTYYSSVRAAARSNLPEAQQVFQLLNAFWQRRRNMSAEPTRKQALRDFKALQRGTKEGEIFIEYEADTVTKGKRTFVDNTRKKPRNNFKEVETGKVES